MSINNGKRISGNKINDGAGVIKRIEEPVKIATADTDRLLTAVRGLMSAANAFKKLGEDAYAADLAGMAASTLERYRLKLA